MMFQNHARIKDRPVNFNIIEYKKFTAMVLDSILQLIFKKLLFVEFWCNLREEII